MNRYFSWFSTSLFSLCIIFNSYAQQDDVTTLAQHRRRISARLDSLEMEKQARKRNGDSIADLESACKSLHDSLTALRTQLSSGEHAVKPLADDEPTPEKSSVPLLLMQSLLKPSNIFDWVIIIVGMTALLSGIILIIGIITAIARRSKKRARQTTHAAPRKTILDRPQKTATEVSPSEASKTADTDDRGIDSLRERVRKDIKDIQRFNAGKQPLSPSDSGSDQRNERENIRETVIRASKEGLDTQEISRRYHVSVDQVSLILRVADKDNSK